MTEFKWLLAQATSAPAGGQPAGASDPIGGFIIPMAIVMIILFYFMNRGQRKEKDKHAKMLAALKRSDRVQTIGGVLGTVVEVRDQEVVLKVDESNNTKIRFNRGAIKEVLHAEPAPDAVKKA